MPPLLAQRARELIYPEQLALKESVTFTVKSQTGSLFTGNTGDHIAYPVAINGYFNWRNAAIARAVCAEGDVIMEIGANIGSETISFSDVVGETGTVYAFEPYPPNVESLRLNAGRTRHRNITIFPVALSDHEGTDRFVSPLDHNSGYGHILGSDEGAEQSPQVIEVRSQTLDSLIAELRQPRLIMIDAEGHESAILRGAEETLAQQPVIVLEVLAHLLARVGSSPVEIARQLDRFGYRLYEIRRFGPVEFPVDDGEIPGASDWIAIPPSAPDLVGRIRRTLTRAGLMPCIPRLNPICSG
jgi:FkbM family methyltransferase